MPRLSDTMEEGTVATWFKNVGDKVSEGDILAEIETDKATMEFEAFYSGVLLHIGIKEGETAPVDQLLAIIGDKGEDISSYLIEKGEAQNFTEEDQKTNGQTEEIIVNNGNGKTESPSVTENVEIIKMPRLSDTMEEGTVSSWLKGIGDDVNEGDILAEIETDKATMEFESFYSGTLLHIGINEGESAKVDSLLAIIGKKGTDVSSLINQEVINEVVSDNDDLDNSKQEVIQDIQEKKIEKVSNDFLVQNSNPDLKGRTLISPLAKKIAKEKGISISQISGSGDGGRIIKRDVENYNFQQYDKKVIPSEIESIIEIENSQMRKTIEKRLASSKFSAPHYYLGVEFDMDNVISFRNQYNSLPDMKISFNDIIIKASALALKKHPEVNSKWLEDKIIHNIHVNIGVAVAVDDGLVVPVLKFANQISLPDIGKNVKDYAIRAREKKLKPSEMDGSTFTISNLGMFGINEFTSIINQPNSAILSVGSIIEKPVVKNGKILIGNKMKLTLACDHRTVDGATGARFLETLKSFIENPILLLV